MVQIKQKEGTGVKKPVSKKLLVRHHLTFGDACVLTVNVKYVCVLAMNFKYVCALTINVRCVCVLTMMVKYVCALTMKSTLRDVCVLTMNVAYAKINFCIYEYGEGTLCRNPELLQHTATHCNTLQHILDGVGMMRRLSEIAGFFCKRALQKRDFFS